MEEKSDEEDRRGRLPVPDMKASALRLTLGPVQHSDFAVADIRCDVEVGVGYLLGQVTRVAAWLPRFFG